MVVVSPSERSGGDEAGGGEGGDEAAGGGPAERAGPGRGEEAHEASGYADQRPGTGRWTTVSSSVITPGVRLPIPANVSENALATR